MNVFWVDFLLYIRNLILVMMKNCWIVSRNLIFRCLLLVNIFCMLVWLGLLFCKCLLNMLWIRILFNGLCIRILLNGLWIMILLNGLWVRIVLNGLWIRIFFSRLLEGIFYFLYFYVWSMSFLVLIIILIGIVKYWLRIYILIVNIMYLKRGLGIFLICWLIYMWFWFMIYIIIDNVWIILVINIICLKIIIYGLLIEVLIGIGWWYCNLLLELIKRLILYLFIVLIGWVIDILRLFLIFL